jgi:hypothetical protein
VRDFFRLVVLTVLAAGCGFTTAVVPLLAPDPEAWICLGFRIDKAFAQELGALSKQAVSFLQQDAGGKVLASTLPAAPAVKGKEQGMVIHALLGPPVPVARLRR